MARDTVVTILKLKGIKTTNSTKTPFKVLVQIKLWQLLSSSFLKSTQNNWDKKWSRTQEVWQNIFVQYQKLSDSHLLCKWTGSSLALIGINLRQDRHCENSYRVQIWNGKRIYNTKTETVLYRFRTRKPFRRQVAVSTSDLTPVSCFVCSTVYTTWQNLNVLYLL